MISTRHPNASRIIVGVDTHKDQHVAVAVDGLGMKGCCQYMADTHQMQIVPKGSGDVTGTIVREQFGAVLNWHLSHTGSINSFLDYLDYRHLADGPVWKMPKVLPFRVLAISVVPDAGNGHLGHDHLAPLEVMLAAWVSTEGTSMVFMTAGKPS